MELSIDEKFNHLSDYLQYRTDIICNKPDYWLNDIHKNYLPSFDYYLQNCVIDKGGNYDFTVRRYKTHFEKTKNINHTDKPLMNKVQKCVLVGVEFSRWHFTSFNYKQIVIVT